MKVLTGWSVVLLSVLLVGGAASGRAEGEVLPTPVELEISSDRADFGLRLRSTRLASGEVALVIGEVIEGGPADRAGIRPGDLIVGMDGPLPDYTNDVERILDFDRRFRAGDKVAVEVETAGSRRIVMVETAVMSRERQSSLLRWLASAEKRIAAGMSLDCGQLSIDSESSWVRFAAQAMSYLSAKLYVTREIGGGFSFATEPASLIVPRDFSVADIDPAIRDDLATLAEHETLRITFTMDNGPHPILDVSVDRIGRRVPKGDAGSF